MLAELSYMHCSSACNFKYLEVHEVEQDPVSWQKISNHCTKGHWCEYQEQLSSFVWIYQYIALSQLISAVFHMLIAQLIYTQTYTLVHHLICTYKLKYNMFICLIYATLCHLICSYTQIIYIFICLFTMLLFITSCAPPPLQPRQATRPLSPPCPLRWPSLPFLNSVK